jgi:CHASE2 domain-containing sensor protein
VGTGPSIRLGALRSRLGAAMLVVAVVALLLGYATWHSGIGNQLELKSVDARFDVRGSVRPSPRVAVVGVDVQTLEALGQPPLSRVYDARMIDVLRRDGVRTIAFDLVFDAKSRSAAADQALLAAAAGAHGHLVLAGTATNKLGQTFVLGGISNQRAAGVTVGSAYFTPDTDGAIRRLPLEIGGPVGGLESFAAAAAHNAGVSQTRLRSLFAAGDVWIDFPGPAGTVPVHSFINVLHGAAAAQLRGRVVVVGNTAPTLQDQHTVSDSALMSGPELEADAISTLLRGAPLRPASTLLNWLTLALMALALPALAVRRLAWPWVGVSGVILGAAGVVGAQLAFDAGTIVLMVPALVTLFVAGIGAILVPLAQERRELRTLRYRFARFDPVVVDAVLADPGVALRLRALAVGPSSVIAGYRLVGLAGRGGMGVVYEAVQLSLERPVALKLIDPTHSDDPAMRARFIRESRAAASLGHPHVIPVYEAGEDDGLLFISMRLVKGGSLDELIAKRAPLAPALAASLVAQLGSALQAAHAKGLVHRDVKPANVLLDLRAEGESQHCYLSDFGVTREERGEGLTIVGERVGTVNYMAPEQWRDEGVGPPADLYSLGCVLFEALTGRIPYPRDTAAARIAAHASDAIPAPSEWWPGVPVAFDAVIARALAKEPADRYASGLEMADAVLSAAGIEQVGVVERPRVRLSVAVDAPTRPGV